jgi:hypothetical protein
MVVNNIFTAPLVKKMARKKLKIKNTLAIVSGVILLSSIFIQSSISANIPISKSMTNSPSCSIFSISINDTSFFGNNEDYYERKLYLWYLPSQNVSTYLGTKSFYATVFVGFPNKKKGNLYPCPCGGMNEHGLAYDIAGLPSLDLVDNPEGSEFYTPNDWYIKASLWDCKNVTEVIEWYKTHKWEAKISGQIHYADASGDAVVVSVNPSTHKWAFTRKTGNFIISTNFNLNDTSHSYTYPCPRYQKMEEMLNEIQYEENLTVQACADVLHAVHVEGDQNTLYSNIFDLVNRDVYFNYGENYKYQKKIHLPAIWNQTEESFEKYNSEEFLGAEGYILVKTEKINDKFYDPNAVGFEPLYIFVFALCTLCFYKRKRNKTEFLN